MSTIELAQGLRIRLEEMPYSWTRASGEVVSSTDWIATIESLIDSGQWVPGDSAIGQTRDEAIAFARAALDIG